MKQGDVLVFMVGVCGPMRKVSTMPAGLNNLQYNCFLGSGMASMPLRGRTPARRGHFTGDAGGDGGRLQNCGRSGRWPTRGSRAGTTRREIFLPTLSATEDSGVTGSARNPLKTLLAGKTVAAVRTG